MLYDDDEPIATKIEKIATTVYGADGIELAAAAREAIARDREAGPRAPADLHGEDAPLALARPAAAQPARRGSSSRSATSASTPAPGMLVPLCGDMLQMPGFGPQPAAFAIDIDENGETVGLF